MSDHTPRFGDDLIRKGWWIVLAIVLLGEVVGLVTGMWRTIAFRAPLTIGVLTLAAALYSFKRTPVELRPQKLRSIAIALTLAALVALFYAATIVRLGGNVFNRPM